MAPQLRSGKSGTPSSISSKKQATQKHADGVVSNTDKKTHKKAPTKTPAKTPVKSHVKTPAKTKTTANKTSRSAKSSPALPNIKSSQSVVSPPSFEDIVLTNLTEKQRSGLSRDFKDKINKIGKSFTALAASKKEFVEMDAKVAQLEETYGKTMKIQHLWRYQERAGLAAILGQDPQAVMNAPHLFKDEERLMYYSAHPRVSRGSPSPTTSKAVAAPSPRRTRTQTQLLITGKTKPDRLSTVDED